MRNLNIKILLIGIMLLFFSGEIFAQKPVIIESFQGSLDFGTFWTQYGGDIIIDKNGGPTYVDPNIISLIPPKSTPVSFFITASKNNNIYISETIVVNPPECILTVTYSRPDPFLYTNNAGLQTEIKMGGILTVPQNPTAGPINGTVTVKFSYINE